MITDNQKVWLRYCGFIIVALLMMQVSVLEAARVVLSGQEIEYSDIQFDSKDYMLIDSQKVALQAINSIEFDDLRLETHSIQERLLFSADSLVRAAESYRVKYPYADGIVLLDNGHFIFHENGVRSYRCHFAGEIEEPSKLSWGDKRIYVERERDRFKLLAARTITPTGEIVYMETAKRELRARESSGYGRNYAVFKLPNLSPGVIVEYIYEIETYNPRDPRLFSPKYFFQWYEPVLNSEVKITVPREEGLKYLAVNFPEGHERTPQEILTDSTHSYSWQLQGVPPLVSEPKMPPYMDVVPHLCFSLFDDYSYISDHLGAIQRRKMEFTTKIENLVTNLTQSLATTEQKVARLYYFAQQRVRYMPTGRGESFDYKGHSAEVTLERGYGNAMDKAILLATMLKGIDVESYPIIIQTNDDGAINRSFPTVAGNHAMNVLYVGGEQVFLDCSGFTFAYPFFRASDCGVSYLNAITGEVGTVYTPTPGENSETIELYLDIDETGAMTAEYRVTPFGPREARYRVFWMMKNPQERDEFFSEWLNNFAPHTELESTEFLHLDNIDSQFVEVVRFDMKDYARQVKDLIVMEIPFIRERYQLGSMIEQPRGFPMQYESPFADIHRIEMQFPEGWEVIACPEDIQLSSRYGSYKASVQVEDNTLAFSDRFEVKERVIPVEECPGFIDFLKKVSHYSSKNIYFKKRDYE